jgi:hypothetical protein
MIIGIILILIICFIPDGFSAIVMEKGGNILISQPVMPGDEISVKFIHSVEKVPVIETYIVNDNTDLILSTAVYGSMGAGLPSDTSYNITYDENNEFLITNISQPFNKVNFITGSIPKHIIVISGIEYPIYEMIDEGKPFILYIKQNRIINRLI